MAPPENAAAGYGCRKATHSGLGTLLCRDVGNCTNGNCTGCPQPNTLSIGEISVQTRCGAVGAFGICVTAHGLFAAGRRPYD